MKDVHFFKFLKTLEYFTSSKIRETIKIISNTALKDLCDNSFIVTNILVQ